MENVGGVDRVGWPVTQGTPFAEGDLRRGAAVRLVDGAGRRLPVQATCLTTWKKDLKHVKWLLLDFQADLRAGQTREVFLEYGPGVRAVSPEQVVTVDRSGGRIRIDTGAMQVDLRSGDPDFFAAAYAAGRLARELAGEFAR